ncbi:MAG: hypothetical protein Fur0027_07120 [Raineya sp.]
MIHQIYSNLTDTLFSVELSGFLQSQNLPPVKHFDLYEKQPFREANEIAYELPAIFAEIKLVQSRKNAGLQELTYSLRLHLEQKILGSTAQNSHNQAETIKHVQFTDFLERFLSKKHPQWELKGVVLDQRGKNNPVHIIEYTITFNRRNC